MFWLCQPCDQCWKSVWAVVIALCSVCYIFKRVGTQLKLHFLTLFETALQYLDFSSCPSMETRWVRESAAYVATTLRSMAYSRTAIWMLLTQSHRRKAITAMLIVCFSRIYLSVFGFISKATDLELKDVIPSLAAPHAGRFSLSFFKSWLVIKGRWRVKGRPVLNHWFKQNKRKHGERLNKGSKKKSHSLLCTVPLWAAFNCLLLKPVHWESQFFLFFWCENAVQLWWNWKTTQLLQLTTLSLVFFCGFCELAHFSLPS